MRITVLGAGLVGHAMVLDLARDGEHEVTAVDRDGSALARLVDVQWREQLATVARLQQLDRAGQAERAALRQQIDKGETLLPIQQRQADDLKRLWQQQALPEYQYLDAERRAIEQRFELAALRQQLVQLDAKLAANEAAVDVTQAAFLRRLLEQGEAFDLQLAANRQARVKARQRLDAYRLTSPADGVVQQLAVHAPGAVVTPAQQLLQLVPSGPRLQVEALVENRDIGFVHPGQQATVKLDSYPFTRHGTLPARVAGLSASVISEPGDRQRYLARVALDRETLESGGSALQVRPGMTATVELRTGQRRVIERGPGPMGIIEAYRGYLCRLDKIWREGRGNVYNPKIAKDGTPVEARGPKLRARASDM